MVEKTKFILVEAVSQFRMRYVVEVPDGCNDWALDTVVCEQAKEFGQKFLDEVIVSHREVKTEELLTLAQEDNKFSTQEYLDSTLITHIKDYQKD